MGNVNKKLTNEEIETLLNTLEKRFSDNMHRHEELSWTDLNEKLTSNLNKLWSLNQMEESGGEPDVVCYDSDKEQYIFFDCAKESPSGRRSVCYDREGLDSRKKYKPENTAMDMATEMGIELLSEEEYRMLQKLEKVDLKTSSWVQTPLEIRSLGGALFCDRRYDHVFLYHNGADSYYAARGFRGSVKV